MTLVWGLGLAVLASAFVAWPLLRARPGEEEAAPPRGGDSELEAEMALDAAAGRIRLGDLEELRERVRRNVVSEG